jgi:hypothetical protein
MCDTELYKSCANFKAINFYYINTLHLQDMHFVKLGNFCKDSVKE